MKRYVEPLLVAAALGLVACIEHPSTTSYDVRRRYEQGRTEVVLEVNRTRISVVERVVVHLEVTGPDTATLPGIDGDMGKFTLVDFDAPAVRYVEDGRRMQEATYVLEPFLAGDYVVPSLEILAGDDTEALPGTRTVRTEEIPIEVISVLPAGETIPEIKDIAPLAELPPTRWGWIGMAVLSSLAVLASVTYVVRRRMEKPAEIQEPVVLPAHELAWQELDRLLAEDLIAGREINLFYTRLTRILRRYIKRRFGFPAPAQTTTEFLVAVDRVPTFSKRYKMPLTAFLDHCDLVKFAGLLPDTETIERSVETCKRFIDETAQTAAEGSAL